MNVDTAKAINDLTANYATDLTKLRDRLMEELKQVNEQLRVVEEFAGIRLPAPTLSGGLLSGVSAVHPDLRPKVMRTLSPVDEKRLADAIAAGNVG